MTHPQYYRHYGIPTALVELDEKFKLKRLHLIRRIQQAQRVVDREMEGTVVHDEAVKNLRFLERFLFKVYRKQRETYEYWRQQGIN